MQKVLFVKSSLSGDAGQSSQLLAHFDAQLPASIERTVIDVVADAKPHLTMTEMGAWMTDAAQRTAAQTATEALSSDAIAAVQAADLVVIGVPMYNFAVPSQLKAWFDRLARAGITFKYTAQGPVGLLADKPIIFVLTRGGLYQGTPLDSQTPYLQAFFNFIGLRNQHFVFAEGLNMGPEAAEKAKTQAKTELEQLARRFLI
ncbi:MAG TPA: FMN-dependent NADH-azoreductase [Rheinheimera sp.]|nr:FMN-dependent NADH-azoreductase [Rheinheimera sp.]